MSDHSLRPDTFAGPNVLLYVREPLGICVSEIPGRPLGLGQLGAPGISILGPRPRCCSLHDSLGELTTDLNVIARDVRDLRPPVRVPQLVSMATTLHRAGWAPHVVGRATELRVCPSHAVGDHKCASRHSCG